MTTGGISSPRGSETSDSGWVFPDVAAGGPGANVSMTIRKVRSSEWVEDVTGSTLAARDFKDSGDLVLEPQAFNWQSGGDARGLDLTDVPSALSTSQTPAVLLTNREGKPGGGKGPLLSTEESLTLATGNGQVLFAPSLTASNDPSRSPQSSEVTQQVAAVHASGYGVRRLTPVECERLQSFPDGWTEPAGSDSARYKAMGNAVTVNVVRWILGRLP